MLICPDDLAPCRRNGCGQGQCKRTGEAPLTSCMECGVMIAKHVVVSVCVECVSVYTPTSEERG